MGHEILLKIFKIIFSLRNKWQVTFADLSKNIPSLLKQPTVGFSFATKNTD